MEQNKFNPVNSIWSEKYRPRYVKDMVGTFKEKILKYLESPESLPHFLLFSRTPGTGKTTLAKAMINELQCDYIVLNSSDDRKIDVIREKVKEFAITQSSKPGLRKCVFMDEFDGMLKASQEALRNIMETYAKNVFFILTCNNINKVHDAIQSRCVKISFAYPSSEEVEFYLIKICKAEGMEYTEEAIKILIEMNRPSIRDSVLVLQDLYTQGLPVTKDTVRPINKQFEDLWKQLIIEKDWKEVKNIVMSRMVDPRQLNKYFWSQEINSDNPIQRRVQILDSNERLMCQGADGEVILCTSLIELAK